MSGTYYLIAEFSQATPFVYYLRNCKFRMLNSVEFAFVTTGLGAGNYYITEMYDQNITKNYHYNLWKCSTEIGYFDTNKLFPIGVKILSEVIELHISTNIAANQIAYFRINVT